MCGFVGVVRDPALGPVTREELEALLPDLAHRGPDGSGVVVGHGVGLEVHEAPSLGQIGREPLVAGDVLAVEPGLWETEIGGVRFEDLLLVTDDGCETLTDYPYELAP